MTLKVTRRPISGWGTTYGPPGDGPFPAVMVLHGSEGGWSGWSHRTAAILAAHGFVALPFGYAKGGNAWNAGSIVDIPLDRTVEALSVLRAQSFVGPKIGVYGASRGAEHALLLTSLMARHGLQGRPDAIAVHSAPDVICGAFDAARWRDPGDPGWQVWDPAMRAWTWRGSSDDLLPTTPIEIERYEGPIFLSHGTADKMWSVEMTRRLAERLKTAGRDPAVHYYEGEDHVLGSAAENQHHERLISFFRQHLRAKGGHSFDKRYPIEDWDQWVKSLVPEFPASRWRRYKSAEEAGWSEKALADARHYSEEIGSAAVMVVFGGAVLAHWGSIERRYKCHSIRKSLLSAIYGQHVTRGTIDFDETLASIGIDDTTPLTDTEKTARVADLLKSRSGIYLPAAYESPEAKRDRPVRGSHQPGTHWYYNNWDFNALATIFNQKTGSDLIVEFNRQLAIPLQMQDFEARHCHYQFELHHSMHPAYPYRMSTRDLARIGLLYLRRGKWRDAQLIPSWWIEESTCSYSEAPSGGYGYMWWIEGGHLSELSAYAAAGLGGHRLYVIPRAQLVFVHRADTYARKQIGDREIHTLLHKILLGWVRPSDSHPTLVDMSEDEKTERHISVPKFNLDALCGEFAQGRSRAVVRRLDDRLEVETSDGRFYLYPRSATEFEVEDTGYRLDFVLDEAGKPKSMRIWWPYEMSSVASPIDGEGEAER